MMSFVVLSQVIVQCECEGRFAGLAFSGRVGSQQREHSYLYSAEVTCRLEQHPSCSRIGTSHGHTVLKVLPIASFIALTVQLQVMKTWK